MRWLLWKDYRHNRLIVIAALVLLLGPYLIGLSVLCGAKFIRIDTHNGQPVYWKLDWKDVLAGSCVYSLFISQFTLALVGGNAISGERVDRSSEFLLSLPIARKRILASKILLALVIAAVVWLFNAACLSPLAAAVPWPQKWPEHIDWGEVAHGILICVTPAVTGLTFFCVGWFLSEFVTSPAFDVCGGFLAPLGVISIIGLIDWALLMSGLSEYRLSHLAMLRWYCASCLTLALVSFGVGTWHYLRRVEP